MMRAALLICMTFLVTDMAGAQWRGTERLDGSGQGFVIDMKVSGKNHYVLFDTFLNSEWTTYLAVSRDGGRTPWERYETSFRNWARFDAQGDVWAAAVVLKPGGGFGTLTDSLKIN